MMIKESDSVSRPTKVQEGKATHPFVKILVRKMGKDFNMLISQAGVAIYKGRSAG